MFALVALVITGVLARQIGNQALTWSDEASRYIFVWLTFIAAAIAIARDEHPRITAVARLLSASWCTRIERALVLAYLSTFFVAGVMYSSSSTGESAATLPLPMTLITSVAAIGAGLMLIFVSFKIGHERQPLREFAWTFSFAAVAAAIGVSFTHASHINVLILMGVVFVLMLLIGVPLAFSLGIASLSALLLIGSIPLQAAAEQTFAGINAPALVAIPLFMLTGAIMEFGGASKRIIAFANVLVGRFAGGLFQVDLVSSAIFAGLSGSSVADTAAIGNIMIPGMVRAGYDAEQAGAVQAAAGSLGVVFPPSIPMIIFGSVAGVSIAGLFLHSLIPGLLILGAYALVAYATARKHRYTRLPAPTWREAGTALRDGLLALLAPVIVLGGVVGGLYTPVEAGAAAALYALVICSVVYREFTWSTAWQAIETACTTTSIVMLIVGSAVFSGWVLTYERLPQTVAVALGAFTSQPILLLAILMVIFIVLHMFIDISSAIIIAVPVFMPLIAAAHISVFEFGILLMLNSAAGIVTPPVGLNLAIAAAIARIRIEQLFFPILPYWGAAVAVMALVLLVPDVITFLPHLFHK